MDSYKGYPHYSEKNCFTTGMLQMRARRFDNYHNPMNSQEFYGINIIAKGEGVHFFEGGRIPAKKGDIFVIPPYFLHGYEGGEGFAFCNLIFTNNFIRKFCSDLEMLPAFSALFNLDPMIRNKDVSGLHLKLSDEELDKTLEMFDNLMEALKIDEGCENMILTNCQTLEFIVHLCRLYDKKVLSEEKNEKSDKPFYRSISHIYENYNKTIETKELLQIAQMSRTAYLNKFKRITGTSPGRFQLKLRAERSAELLTETSMSISEISEMVGCYDTSHFSKMFLREYGVSPSDYRRKKREEKEQ